MAGTVEFEQVVRKKTKRFDDYGQILRTKNDNAQTLETYF
jgi:hypothetical protein